MAIRSTRMFRARDLRRRSARQVVLAALVLVAVTAGSLAHIHRHRGDASTTSHCTACMLHTVVSDPAPAIVVPSPPLAPRQERVVIAVRPVDTTHCPLSLAPKTSPPVVA